MRIFMPAGAHIFTQFSQYKARKYAIVRQWSAITIPDHWCATTIFQGGDTDRCLCIEELNIIVARWQAIKKDIISECLRNGGEESVKRQKKRACRASR